MIYTVTLNPSLDYIVKLNDFRLGEINRSTAEAVIPGGKGINVSWMLTNLGVPTAALGFLAGFTGEEIRKNVRALGIKEDFRMLESGFSRINVKVKAGEETEINGMGPAISEEEFSCFLADTETRLCAGDTLVLSGSVPKTLFFHVYRVIAERMRVKGIRIVVDAAGNVLADVLPCRPFLIKPNHRELGELFGAEIETREDAAFYGEKLRLRGAVNVLVSMARKGAVLVSESGVFYADAPKGSVVNSVGAGDSMLAGFLAGSLNGGSAENALRLAVAAGSASAFSEGIAARADVEQLLPFVKIIQK